MAEPVVGPRPDEQLRSLHVIASDARRGAETYATQLARALRDAGGNAHVVALVPSGGSATYDVPILGSSRRSVRTLKQLRAAASVVDVVVAHGSSTLEACAVGLVGLKTPFVYRTIGDPSYWVRTRAREQLIHRMLLRAERHVVLWGGAASYLTTSYGIPRDRISVIPNAVPEGRFDRATEAQRAAARSDYGLRDGQPCLAFVGAMSEEKNVSVAIDACASIDDAVLLLAGEGTELAQLRRRADASLGARARFLGPLDDLTNVYRAADLLLLPSRSEGMPAVLIEAGLVGRAAVASAVGSVPEMVTDGVTGFLVDPLTTANYAQRLSEALRSARSAGQDASVQFRARYTLERTAHLWTDVLESAVAG
jgi:glycosyltransferase involved in cell wall biosynthesis